MSFLFLCVDDRFTEHPANISAVEGNRVSFECNLLSDSDNIFWQRNNSTIIEFLTSSTPPGLVTVQCMHIVMCSP